MKGFIKVLNNVSSRYELLNIDHIIRVKPCIIKNYKHGQPDYERTKIELMGGSLIVDLSIDEIEQLLQR
jgi:hypothetical protein